MPSCSGKQWEEQGKFSTQESLFQNFLRITNKKKSDFDPVFFHHFANPFLFSDAKKAVELVEKNIAEKNRILIFGDYDLDGMSGTAQLFLTLKILGAEVSFRLPSREDGYGLSEKFVREGAEKNVKLFITTDCGVSSFKEISLAKNLGMEVIITDHHTVPEHLPPADAILHPLVTTENFPDKHLTGAGVAWFLCSALLRNRFGAEKSAALEEELLELALLGTIADCGLLHGENRKIAHLGLEKLKTTRNGGLQKLLEISGTKPEKISAESVAFFLAPRLNASGRLSHPRLSLELLLGNAERATELEKLNQERQEMVENFLEDIEENFLENKNSVAFLLKNKHWPAGVIGLLAGRLAEKYFRPVIAMEEMEEKVVGSCRGPVDFHFSKTLKEISVEHPSFFLGFGGHAQAAGFSLRKEFFEDFKKIFLEKVEQKRGKTPPIPKISFLCTLEKLPKMEEIEELSHAEPFGLGNPVPVFRIPGMKISKIRRVGKNEDHVSLWLQSPWKSWHSAIFFRGKHFVECLQEGDEIDILASLETKEWNGEKSIALKGVDIWKKGV